MTPKNYHINFYGNLPQKVTPQGIEKHKIRYKKDILHFETKQELMEFFEDPQKIAEHLQHTDIVKMMVNNLKDGKFFEPIVTLAPYFEGENGNKLWFDEIKEVDLGFPTARQQQQILNKEGK